MADPIVSNGKPAVNGLDGKAGQAPEVDDTDLAILKSGEGNISMTLDDGETITIEMNCDEDQPLSPADGSTTKQNGKKPVVLNAPSNFAPSRKVAPPVSVQPKIVPATMKPQFNQGKVIVSSTIGTKSQPIIISSPNRTPVSSSPIFVNASKPSQSVISTILSPANVRGSSTPTGNILVPFQYVGSTQSTAQRMTPIIIPAGTTTSNILSQVNNVRQATPSVFTKNVTGTNVQASAKLSLLAKQVNNATTTTVKTVSATSLGIAAKGKPINSSLISSKPQFVTVGSKPQLVTVGSKSHLVTVGTGKSQVMPMGSKTYPNLSQLIVRGPDGKPIGVQKKALVQSVPAPKPKPKPPQGPTADEIMKYIGNMRKVLTMDSLVDSMNAFRKNKSEDEEIDQKSGKPKKEVIVLDEDSMDSSDSSDISVCDSPKNVTESNKKKESKEVKPKESSPEAPCSSPKVKAEEKMDVDEESGEKSETPKCDAEVKDKSKTESEDDVDVEMVDKEECETKVVKEEDSEIQPDKQKSETADDSKSETKSDVKEASDEANKVDSETDGKKSDQDDKEPEKESKESDKDKDVMLEVGDEDKDEKVDKEMSVDSKTNGDVKTEKTKEEEDTPSEKKIDEEQAADKKDDEDSKKDEKTDVDVKSDEDKKDGEKIASEKKDDVEKSDDKKEGEISSDKKEDVEKSNDKENEDKKEGETSSEKKKDEDKSGDKKDDDSKNDEKSENKDIELFSADGDQYSDHQDVAKKLRPVARFLYFTGLDLAKEHIYNDIVKSRSRKLAKGKLDKKEEIQLRAMKITASKLSERNNTANIKKFGCKCGFKTNSENILFKHNQEGHVDKTGRYICALCDFDTRVVSMFTFHMEAEHNVKATPPPVPSFWNCSHCSFDHSSKAKMTKHIFKCVEKFDLKKHLFPTYEDINFLFRSLPGDPITKYAAQPTSSVGSAVRPIGTTNKVYQQQRPRVTIASVPQTQTKIVSKNSVYAGQKVLVSQNSAGQQPVYYYMTANGPVPVSFSNGKGTTTTVVTKASGGVTTSIHRPSILSQGPPRVQPAAVGGAGVVRNVIAKKRPATTGAGPVNKAPRYDYEICEICGGFIKDKESLRIHFMMAHKIEIAEEVFMARKIPPLNCDHCPDRFWTFQGLTHHKVSKNHATVPPTLRGGYCALCKTDVSHMANHLSSIHDLNLATVSKCQVCPCCGQTFKNLSGHLLSQHGVTLRAPVEKIYKCNTCPSTFKSAGALSKHIKDCHTIRCYSCKAHFGTREEFFKHFEAEHRDDIVKCELCDAEFSLGSNMYIKHMEQKHLKDCAVKLKRCDRLKPKD